MDPEASFSGFYGKTHFKAATNSAFYGAVGNSCGRRTYA